MMAVERPRLFSSLAELNRAELSSELDLPGQRLAADLDRLRTTFCSTLPRPFPCTLEQLRQLVASPRSPSSPPSLPPLSCTMDDSQRPSTPERDTEVSQKETALVDLPQTGILSDIISSVLNGGVNKSVLLPFVLLPFGNLLNGGDRDGARSGLIIGMHSSFAGLFLVLVALWVLTGFNGHVLALSAISICLWASTGW